MEKGSCGVGGSLKDRGRKKMRNWRVPCAKYALSLAFQPQILQSKILYYHTLSSIPGYGEEYNSPLLVCFKHPDTSLVHHLPRQGLSPWKTVIVGIRFRVLAGKHLLAAMMLSVTRSDIKRRRLWSPTEMLQAVARICAVGQ